jgi:iron-sulfur cluster assembly accessory protein
MSNAEGGCCGGGESKAAPIKPVAQEAGAQAAAGTPYHDGKDIFFASDEQPVLFTPEAVAAVKHAISQEGQAGDGLRVSVVGGGCSGLQYNLEFEKEERMGDTVLSFDGTSIYVDEVSVGYLRGTVIDHVSSLQESGFKFINPNAKRSCGCGSSFS